VDLPGLYRSVVAFPQVIEDPLVQGGISPGAGFLNGRVSLAQDGDNVSGPVLDAAGAEFGDRAAASYHVGGALLDAGQPG